MVASQWAPSQSRSESPSIRVSTSSAERSRSPPPRHGEWYRRQQLEESLSSLSSIRPHSPTSLHPSSFFPDLPPGEVGGETAPLNETAEEAKRQRLLEVIMGEDVDALYPFALHMRDDRPRLLLQKVVRSGQGYVFSALMTMAALWCDERARQVLEEVVRTGGHNADVAVSQLLLLDGREESTAVGGDSDSWEGWSCLRCGADLLQVA